MNNAKKHDTLLEIKNLNFLNMETLVFWLLRLFDLISSPLLSSRWDSLWHSVCHTYILVRSINNETHQYVSDDIENDISNKIENSNSLSSPLHSWACDKMTLQSVFGPLARWSPLAPRFLVKSFSTNSLCA